MSSNLYLFFDVSNSNDVVHRALEELVVPGYSFWRDGGGTLDAPGEPSVPVRSFFYAHYSRIFLADQAILFCREPAVPPELASGERHLVAAILEMTQFHLRRWLLTEEDYDDEDEPFVNLLREGSDAVSLRVELGMAVPT